MPDAGDAAEVDPAPAAPGEPATPASAIDVAGLVKRYGVVRAVDGVSFQVQPGEVVGYLGPNGAGKSSTIKILVGLLPADGGACRVAGVDVAADPVEAKRRIGYVPESGALYESLSPFEYLQMHAELRGLDDAVAEARIERELRRFGIFDKVFARMQGFSKGQKQKVVLASALLHDPAVLFLDEPLNGLDVHSTLLVKDLIRERAAAGCTIFYSSHFLDVVEKICDRVILLDRGRVVLDTSMAEALAQAGDGALEGVFRELTASTTGAPVAGDPTAGDAPA